MSYLSRLGEGEMIKAGVVWEGFLEVELSQVLKAAEKEQEEESWREEGCVHNGRRMYSPEVGVIILGQRLIQGKVGNRHGWEFRLDPGVLEGSGV